MVRAMGPQDKGDVDAEDDSRYLKVGESVRALNHVFSHCSSIDGTRILPGTSTSCGKRGGQLIFTAT